MAFDIGWLLLVLAVHRLVVCSRIRPEARSRAQAIAVVVSLFFFDAFSRDASVGGVPAEDTFLTGAVFGTIALCVVIVVQLRASARMKG